MQHENQSTRWAVIRVLYGKRRVVDTWAKEGDAWAEAAFRNFKNHGPAYFIVEPAT